MNHGRYQRNQPLSMYAQDFAGGWLQQFYMATKKIKSHYEGSCEEGDH